MKPSQFRKIKSLNNAFFFALFLVSLSSSYAWAADQINIRNFAGDAVGTETGGTLAGHTSESGSTQVIRVGVDEIIDGAEEVEIVVSTNLSVSEVEVLDENGVALTLDAFTLSVANGSEKILLLKGVDDTDQDGDVTEIVTFTTASSSVAGITDGKTYALRVINSDNDGLSTSTAPSEPTLRYPLEGASFATDEAFLWEHAYDREKDTLTYQLCVRAEEVTIPKCVSVADTSIVPGSGVAVLSWPIVLAIALSFLLYKFKTRRRRRTAIHIVQFAPQVKKHTPSPAIIVLLLLLTVACGNKALIDALQVSPRPSVTATFPDLQAGKTYFWKVYADDENGNVIASSQEYSFEAKAP